MPELNDLIGKPFASDPEHAFGPQGYSCYGLIWEVMRRYGIHIPRINISVTACKETSDQTIAEHAAKYWQQIQGPEEPCAVVLTSTNPDYAAHIAAYVGKGRILHVTLNHNVALDRLSDWRRRVIGYYRYVGNS